MAGMIEVWFRGRKIGEKQRLLVEEAFHEKIDDLELLNAVLGVAGQKGYELERGAFTRALKHGYCADSDGGRAAKALIKRVRKKLGYKYSLGESVTRMLGKKKAKKKH